MEIERGNYENGEHAVGTVDEEKKRFMQIREAKSALYDVEKFEGEPYYHKKARITGVYATRKHIERIRDEAKKRWHTAIVLEAVDSLEWQKLEFQFYNDTVNLYYDDLDALTEQVKSEELLSFDSQYYDDFVGAWVKTNNHPSTS